MCIGSVTVPGRTVLSGDVTGASSPTLSCIVCRRCLVGPCLGQQGTRLISDCAPPDVCREKAVEQVPGPRWFCRGLACAMSFGSEVRCNHFSSQIMPLSGQAFSLFGNLRVRNPGTFRKRVVALVRVRVFLAATAIATPTTSADSGCALLWSSRRVVFRMPR